MLENVESAQAARIIDGFAPSLTPMKQHLSQLLHQAVESLQAQGILPPDQPIDINLERTRDRSHGDFASNLAMVLCRLAHSKPRELAEKWSGPRTSTASGAC